MRNRLMPIRKREPWYERHWLAGMLFVTHLAILIVGVQAGIWWHREVIAKYPSRVVGPVSPLGDGHHHGRR